MPLTLSLMEEDDIPAFAALDEAAMANWGLAIAMNKSLGPGEPRRVWIEKFTRAGYQNDSNQVWLKVVDKDTDGMVAAAMWRFQLDEKKPANEPTAPEEAKAPQQPAKQPGVLAAMGKLGDRFKDEFVGQQPHACQYRCDSVISDARRHRQC